jgi:hypothetical protein
VQKTILISCLSLLICSVVFFAFPSVAAAGPQPEDQNTSASFLHLAATGPVVYGKSITGEKTGRSDASHAVSIPLNHDFKAFVDFTQPSLQDGIKKKNTPDIRTVFGFHIPLK